MGARGILLTMNETHTNCHHIGKVFVCILQYDHFTNQYNVLIHFRGNSELWVLKSRDKGRLRNIVVKIVLNQHYIQVCKAY